MKVLFLSPHYPEEMIDFSRGLAEVNAQVYGVGDIAAEQLPERVRPYLHDYIQAPILDEDQAFEQLLPVVRRLGIHRVETLWEPCVLLAARLREALGLDGMDLTTALGFRDKSVMKARLVEAGVRVPRFAQVETVRGVLEAAKQIGYPVVVKPIAGAGTRDTYRVDSIEQAEKVLGRMGHVSKVSVEEFIQGEELTYDAVVIRGKPAFESVMQYHPPPLQSRTQEWISPAQITLRDPYVPELQPGIDLGRQVLEALRMGTGFVHMEWFRTRDGQAVFGEIGARNGGGKLVDQINYANDIDIFREWARSVCWYSFEAVPQRRYHVVGVFKRAQGQGRIQAVEGLDAVRRRAGAGLMVVDILPIGHGRRDWRSTLLSDGYVIMRSPDYGECCEMRDVAVNALRIYAG